MRCPYCQSSDTWRLQPAPWMNHIHPRMSNRRCSVCGHEFALWFKCLSLKHRTAHNIVFLSHVLLCLLAVCVAVDIYQMSVDPLDSYILKAAATIGDFLVNKVAPLLHLR